MVFPGSRQAISRDVLELGMAPNVLPRALTYYPRRMMPPIDLKGDLRYWGGEVEPKMF